MAQKHKHDKGAAAALGQIKGASKEVYKQVLDHAELISEEWERWKESDPDEAGDTLRQFIEATPEYEDPNLAFTVSNAIGYVWAAAHLVGAEPWDLVAAVSAQAANAA